tara:strand:- start:3305 stop:3712 length:408 start_codon:yes stop_codon:yes gene_type:complete
MRRLKIFFKWKYLRWKSKQYKKYFNKRKLNIDEKLIKNVLVKVVSNPNSIILISPLSKTIYIQTENKNYTIVLFQDKIKITNHKLFIETPTDLFFNQELFDIVHFYVEKYRLEMDREIFKNEVDGLQYMLNQLNK